MEYVSTHYNDKVYLPLALIKSAINENWLDSLCYYVWMKRMHRKPVIYGYSLRKISAGINCSPTTVKTHLSVLKEHGLVNIYAGNLILISTRKLFTFNQLMVPVSVSENKAEQRNLLRFAVCKRNLHSQCRQFKAKIDVLKYHKGLVTGFKAVKSALKKVKLYPDQQTLESSMQNEMTLSNKRFGSLCNRSQATGAKIQRAFNSLDLIVSYARTRLIDAKQYSRRVFYKFDLDLNHFLSKRGQIFKRLSNGITLKISHQ